MSVRSSGGCVADYVSQIVRWVCGVNLAVCRSAATSLASEVIAGGEGLQQAVVLVPLSDGLLPSALKTERAVPRTGVHGGFSSCHAFSHPDRRFLVTGHRGTPDTVSANHLHCLDRMTPSW